MWVGSKAEDLDNQLEYIEFIEENETTDVYDILTADNEEDAKELGIIDEDGGWI